MAQITYPVTFDNVDLATINGLTVLSTNPYAIPKRTLSNNQISRASLSKTTLGLYTQRDIVIHVGITRNTRNEVELSLDSLMAIVQGLEKYLVVPQSNTLRRYTATLSDVNITTSGGAYVEMDLVFSCSDKFGYSLQYEQLLNATGRTLYNYTDALTFGGSADTQLPVITAFISAFSGATNNTVTLMNVATAQSIAVNRAWTAGDRLIIDPSNTLTPVTVNGAAVDYSGAFPVFAPGAGYLNYQDNFSTRTLALSVYYYKRFV